MKHKDEHTRQELDPASVAPQDESAVPPEGSSQLKAQDPAIQKQLGEMITSVSGVSEEEYEHRLVRDLMTAALKLIPLPSTRARGR